MTPVFAHVIDGNLGDIHCSPRKCLPWPDAKEYDFRKLPPGDSPVVVGGGGLLHPGPDSWIREISDCRPVYVFGIGLNYSVIPEHWWGPLEHCRLVGLRDRFIPYEPPISWCPCPSVLTIDWERYRKIQSTRRTVYYSHYRELLPVWGDEMTNAGNKPLESVLEFLASGSIVITNSYHGALWGRMLNRRVIVYGTHECRTHFLDREIEHVHTPDQLRWHLHQHREPTDVYPEFRMAAETYRDMMVRNIEAL